MTTQFMIRFGELNTKGKNKKDFINTLKRNISHSLSEINNLKIITTHDHIYVDISNIHEEDEAKVVEILKNISGIYSFAKVYVVEDFDFDKITDFVLDYINKNKTIKTFKIECRRSDKTFPLYSRDIIYKVATSILKKDLVKVDVHNPDLVINIEIHQKNMVFFFETIKGVGGYPIGTIGKSLMLISGGIDSPVASFLMMKRGVKLSFIHFASPPYTQEAVIEKIKDLLGILNTYQEKIDLYIVPFTKIQEEIYKNSDVSYAITILRRMMYKISKKLAEKLKIKSLCNGESIGQVASQTIESMDTITKGIDMTIFRPLSVMDKDDIVRIAKEIKTYDISIRPYEDCCTIFKPKNPKTMPKLDEVLFYESKVDYDSLIEEAINNIEKIEIKKEKFEI